MQLTKKKKTPKSSNKRPKKTKERVENITILGTFLVFIIVLVGLFYFVNIKSDEDIVATVNGNEITIEELDWWYKTSILPEYRDFITKQDFLMLSLIPQEVLLQQSKKENIKVTEDEVEKLFGLFIIENGLSLEEFEKHLNSRGIAINEIKKSFEIRASITKLLEKENINFDEEDEKLSFDANDIAFQEYLNNLVNDSNIEIFPENIDKLLLRSFEATNDEICNEEKPIIRLYTTSSCGVCEDSGKVFKNLVEDLDEKVEAFHWSLDTGDDLLTLEKETGVPKEEVALFKKYSPNNLVPAVVIGCRYKHVGKFGVEEEDEFKDILKTLTS